MFDLTKFIKEKRPTLSDSSIKTYNSILRSLYGKIFKDDTKLDTDKFDSDSHKIVEFLKDEPSNKRKTILSALVVVTNNQIYRTLMLTDIKDYSAEIKTQDKSETQKENWVSTSDINTIYDKLKSEATMLYKKPLTTMNDLQNIQSYIILSLLGGKYIPPRRSLDFCNFKIKSINKEKDNYLDKNVMYFNSYKTAKCYGQQNVEIPKELKSILTKWIKMNPTEYLLFDANQNPLTAVKLNQRLNKIFDGKRVAVNQLRHTYLTDKYGETIAKNKQIADTMTEMGSSANMLTTYVKHE